jgi:hypothetical protein
MLLPSTNFLLILDAPCEAPVNRRSSLTIRIRR